PVHLAPPGENARQVRHHGSDRHDGNGLLRPVLIDQHRHQHDRRAGADDARDGAGEKADDEDEEEAHESAIWPHGQKRRKRVSSGMLLTAGWQQGPAMNAATSDHLEGTVPIKGSCHCGNTQFEVSEAPASVTRCTCSLCSKRGALWAYYTPAQFRL